MQDKEINGFILLPVPVENVMESGLDIDGVIEVRSEDGKIIIENIRNTEKIFCDENCGECPLKTVCLKKAGEANV